MEKRWNWGAAAQTTTRNMLVENMPNAEMQQTKKMAKAIQSFSRQKAILSTAKSHESLVLTSDALDKNKSLLTLQMEH